MAPFRGQKRTDPRGAFLQFRTIDDARTALRTLDGRKGPGGETLCITLSRPPAMHPNRLWRWACIQEGTEEEAAFFENECDGLGFGTGSEDNDRDSEAVDDAPSERRNQKRRPSCIGRRGGRFRYWMKARWNREKNKDALRSHPLWTMPEGENEEKDSVEEGEGERKSVPLRTFLRPTRRHQLTSMVRDSADHGRAE